LWIARIVCWGSDCCGLLLLWIADCLLGWRCAAWRAVATVGWPAEWSAAAAVVGEGHVWVRVRCGGGDSEPAQRVDAIWRRLPSVCSRSPPVTTAPIPTSWQTQCVCLPSASAGQPQQPRGGAQRDGRSGGRAAAPRGAAAAHHHSASRQDERRQELKVQFSSTHEVYQGQLSCAPLHHHSAGRCACLGRSVQPAPWSGCPPLTNASAVRAAPYPGMSGVLLVIVVVGALAWRRWQVGSGGTQGHGASLREASRARRGGPWPLEGLSGAARHVATSLTEGGMSPNLTAGPRRRHAGGQEGRARVERCTLAQGRCAACIA
jgi:hypothetical protein